MVCSMEVNSSCLSLAKSYRFLWGSVPSPLLHQHISQGQKEHAVLKGFCFILFFKKSTFNTSSPTDLPRSKDSISWVVPTAVSVTGVLLLVLILVVAMVVTGRLKERRQKKREMDSCWTETSYPTTEISFDNYMFTVSMVSYAKIQD